MADRSLKVCEMAFDSLKKIHKFSQSDLSGIQTTGPFTIRLKRIQEYLTEFIKCDNKLLEKQDYVSNRVDFEDLFIETQSALTEAIELREFKDNSEPHNDLNSTLNQFINQQRDVVEQFNKSSQFKLPKPPLKQFDGEFETWPTFKELYVSSIHEKTTLNDCEKFQLLLRLLTGDALEQVCNLPSTKSGYDLAWKKLVNRYDKPKKIMSTHISNFLSLKSSKQLNVRELRRIYDKADLALRGLEILGEEAKSRDPWLIEILSQKIDSETLHLWSHEMVNENFPTIEMFLEFLDKRCTALESCCIHEKKSQSHVPPSKKSSSSPSFSFTSGTAHSTKSTLVPKCSFCEQSHILHRCMKFRNLDVNSRKQIVVKNQLCYNCLNKGHSVQHCNSKSNCQICNKRHHTLLHGVSYQNTDHLLSNHSNSEAQTSIQTSDPITETIITNTALTSAQTHGRLAIQKYSILPTAVIFIKDKHNQLQPARALLDSGSQSSFITEACIQKLGLPRTHSCIKINGISTSAAGRTRGKTLLQIYSHQSRSHVIDIDTLIISHITSNLPSADINISDCDHFTDLNLADPSFFKSAPIDVLIGIDAFFLLLCNQSIVRQNKPIAQLSKLGWLVAGPLQIKSLPDSMNSFHTSIEHEVDEDVHNLLKKFWELEEIPDSTQSDISNNKSEILFTHTTRRTKEGRFVVRLPFNDMHTELGDSKRTALARLRSMENKFEKYKDLKEQYTNFMEEYITLNHMERIDSIDEQNMADRKCFYLPHHCVIKSESSTTKLRVVFDGSSKTTSGVSLNDKLMIGPKVQDDLVSVLLRFRCHEIALVADLEKMYRQVRVDEEDVDFQRIFWRNKINNQIESYRLLTVTYGTSCAPYLAVRTLQQIGLDHQNQYPQTSNVILRDFYVDDLLTGCQTVDEAVKRKEELSNILKSAGFSIRKWKSNSTEFLSHIPSPDIDMSATDISDNQIVKTLGIRWDPVCDNFSFTTPEDNFGNNITKRNILSYTSKFYDPLGWMSPIIIKFKVLLQRLWVQKLSWDEVVPESITQEWLNLIRHIDCIQNINIPRSIASSLSSTFELHGFCDASETAYGAAVYCRSWSSDSSIVVRLIATKSRVAPIQQVSLPRLELCAAHLLTKLFIYIKTALGSQYQSVMAWTDSRIVLHWLSDIPRRWKSFIGNRTSQILQVVPRSNWSHIPSKMNPADHISRGINAKDLTALQIFWEGPPFLKQPVHEWPKQLLSQQLDPTIDKEQRREYAFLTTNDDCVVIEIINRCSSFLKVKMIVAYIFKFIALARKDSTTISSLCPVDLLQAETCIWKSIQKRSFSRELAVLERNKPIPPSSTLSTLSPFIDDKGVLRIGGRLQNSTLSFAVKHPIIIPKGHPIVKLIIRDYHLRNLHAGFTQTHNSIRQKFWLINARVEIKRFIKSCTVCVRHRAINSQQLMGTLPSPRVSKNRPFLFVGVDFAGPITVKPSKMRKAPLLKAYLCIFVCLSVKAVHIEVVSDMTSEAFLAALRRFVSRRGIPVEIWCDNGRNFVGGDRELQNLYLQFKTNVSNNLIVDFSLQNSISFKFIPPTASHFGGLWEAAVKSAKFHMKRVMKDANLTFEEATTLTCQIESIMNSRPMYSVPHDDPSHINVLTPSHFLIGDLLTSIPEPWQSNPAKSSTMWKNIQSRQQSFWRSWESDYLCGLQQRNKWKNSQPNLEINDIVVVKNENLPPSKWALAKIIAVHPGPDGLVRVVTIKTSNTTVKRPISKLCKLPTST